MKTGTHYGGRLLLGGAVALTLMQAGPAAAQIQVDVNQRPVQFGNVGPARIGGRVFIPLRAVVEALGADVRWDRATQTVHGSKGGREFALPIGARTALVNGRSLSLDAPARLIAGNTMVPLRFVAEALGADVDWNAAQQTVAINLADGATVADRDTGRGNERDLDPIDERDTGRINDRDRGRIDDRDRGRIDDRDRGRIDDRDRGRVDDRDRGRVDDRDSGRVGRGTDDPLDRTTGRVPRASRTVSGKVIRVVRRANPPLMIVMTNGARQTFDIGSAVISHRATSGDQLVEATIQDIVAGDDVIIRLDRTGQVARRIEVTHGTGR